MKTENLLVLGLIGYALMGKAEQLVQTTASAPSTALAGVTSTAGKAWNELQSSLGIGTKYTNIGTLRQVPGTNEFYYFNAPSWDASTISTYTSYPKDTLKLVDNLTAGNYNQVWTTEGNTQYGYLVL